jgi:hypothetical protein
LHYILGLVVSHPSTPHVFKHKLIDYNSVITRIIFKAYREFYDDGYKICPLFAYIKV